MTAPTEREQRYAEACGTYSWHRTTAHFQQTIDAVMAVADAELADLPQSWANATVRWIDRAKAAEDKVTRVEALHVRDGDFCRDDGFTWPCRTRRELDGES